MGHLYLKLLDQQWVGVRRLSVDWRTLLHSCISKLWIKNVRCVSSPVCGSKHEHIHVGMCIHACVCMCVGERWPERHAFEQQSLRRSVTTSSPQTPVPVIAVHIHEKTAAEITRLCSRSTRTFRINTQNVNVCSEKIQKIKKIFKYTFIQRLGEIKQQNWSAFTSTLPSRFSFPGLQEYRRSGSTMMGPTWPSVTSLQGRTPSCCWSDRPGADRSWDQMTEDLKPV